MRKILGDQGKNSTVKLVWDGRGKTGKLVPAGTFIIRAKAGSFEKETKLVVLN